MIMNEYYHNCSDRVKRVGISFQRRRIPIACSRLHPIVSIYPRLIKAVLRLQEDSQANGQGFMKEFGITYDNGIDQSNIGGKYGITGIPETFWIGKNGQLVNHPIGSINEVRLTDRTQRLLKHAIKPGPTPDE